MPPLAFCAGPRRPRQEAISISSPPSTIARRRPQFLGVLFSSTSQGPTVSRSTGWPHPRTTRPNRRASVSAAPRPWPQPETASAKGAVGALQLLPYPPQSRRIPSIPNTGCADRPLNFNFHAPLSRHTTWRSKGVRGISFTRASQVLANTLSLPLLPFNSYSSISHIPSQLDRRCCTCRFHRRPGPQLASRRRTSSRVSHGPACGGNTGTSLHSHAAIGGRPCATALLRVLHRPCQSALLRA